MHWLQPTENKHKMIEEPSSSTPSYDCYLLWLLRLKKKLASAYFISTLRHCSCGTSSGKLHQLQHRHCRELWQHVREQDVQCLPPPRPRLRGQDVLMHWWPTTVVEFAMAGNEDQHACTHCRGCSWLRCSSRSSTFYSWSATPSRA